MSDPSAVPPAGIVVRGVARSFGDVHAVRSADFEVPAGSVTGLIGPNGSGKTTLMLMLASLLRPDAGEIRIAGYDPVTQPAAVRSIMGWMPDILGSWASLSPRTALEITGRMYGIGTDATRQRAAELIGLVGLAALADQPARVLSRGQKQRLSLARALVHNPRVLLLDEPASGLDPAARADLRTLLRRLADEGTAILVSSHVLAELEEMADAAVYMSAGVTASRDAISRAATAPRQWRIRALDAARLTALLPQIGVDPGRIAADGRGVLVSVSGEADAAALLRALVTAGIEISSFAPAVGEFEHTFLDLTREQPPQPKGGVA
ncbi:ABC-type multidrug transport system, ATPase component [Paramicrobacterium humi]|uniref:ABC-type multidrug transport system, ATPase component n=1 Tax=Paramicrobacterium humi TaxID=640635 RepID=A0A1H4K0P1_9MICO|nr:ABC transporter ATP-binding protein [Microbacterium humi]SEB51648.1 ABC-type multidrug transport system, ATPase component [Microbacterium humi]